MGGGREPVDREVHRIDPYRLDEVPADWFPTVEGFRIGLEDLGQVGSVLLWCDGDGGALPGPRLARPDLARRLLLSGPQQLAEVSRIVELPGLVELRLRNAGAPWLFESFAPLQALRWLDLSGNALTMLPADMNAVQGLESVQAQRNQLVRLPADLGTLRRLRYLDVSRNCLDSVPPGLSGLGELRELRLRGNRFTAVEMGRILRKFGSKPQLRLVL